MPTVSTVLGSVFVDDQGTPNKSVALLWPSLAIEPPGHGQSPGPGRGFTMDECAEAVIQILDATGINTPVAYLGTSWGGFVATSRR